MTMRQLGPIFGATLVTAAFEQTLNAYCLNLNFRIKVESTVSDQLAQYWQAPALAGARFAVLAAPSGDAWLRVVEDSSAVDAQPLKRHGWLALETNVADVDKVRAQLDEEQFKVIGEPAFLQVSDAIKAMQVIGPAGEVSYLTEVKREVPPFELPQTKYLCANLFIPVLAVPNRAAAVAFYESLNQADPALQFDTKITVLNRSLGKPIEHQYAVATLQLDGLCLFEIDEVPEAAAMTHQPGHLPAGIAMITCFCKDLKKVATQFNQPIIDFADGYSNSEQHLLLQGPAGELIELIQVD